MIDIVSSIYDIYYNQSCYDVNNKCKILLDKYISSTDYNCFFLSYSPCEHFIKLFITANINNTSIIDFVNIKICKYISDNISRFHRINTQCICETNEESTKCIIYCLSNIFIYYYSKYNNEWVDKCPLVVSDNIIYFIEDWPSVVDINLSTKDILLLREEVIAENIFPSNINLSTCIQLLASFNYIILNLDERLIRSLSLSRHIICYRNYNCLPYIHIRDLVEFCLSSSCKQYTLQYNINRIIVIIVSLFDRIFNLKFLPKIPIKNAKNISSKPLIN